MKLYANNLKDEKTIWVILDKTTVEFAPICAFASKESAYAEAEELELDDYDICSINLFEE